ncbi:MAG TPA: hypothetical protein VFI17_09060 [Solirubrobacterales bacterium]|nr:hypothetical protein [Solirubrobacterales bacterium]
MAATLGGVLAGAAAGRTATDPTEVEAPGGYGEPLTLGPGEALWFASGKRLGRIDAEGNLTAIPLSESVGSPEDIAAGQEGDLWVTRGHEVDRIAPGGEVSRFPLPNEDERAGQIAVGPDGTLWLTVWVPRRRRESSFGKAYVVRLRTDGGMTSFPIPGPARRRDVPPAAIVADPGGGAWFTDPGLGRVGRVTPRGKITGFRVRLQPEALAADGVGGFWFVGGGGVGKIDASGKVRELRTGSFLGIGIGSSHDAVVGPEGDLWFIGGATRVMRLTPSGQLTVIRGPGAPAASHLALGPGGSVWVSTVPDPIKGVMAAPLLRYAPGSPGVEVRPGTAIVSDGKVRVRLACGGSTSGCTGEVGIAAERKGTVSAAYHLAADSVGAVTLGLPAGARRLLARRGYERASAFASVEGGYGGFTELVLRSPHPPLPRPGRPVVMPLPEGIEVDGLARGPDGALWTGGDIGRFNRITPKGHVSTVNIPGLSAQPSPIGSDSRHNLWFIEYGDSFEDSLVLGRLAPGRKLSRIRLPAGPRWEGSAAVGSGGDVWVVRSEYPHPGEIDRINARGEVSRFRVGVEPGAIAADRSGGVWFAESGPRIGHISASGEMGVYPLPGKGFVGGMTVGRHGVVWFTHWARRRLPPAIGHITPDGQVSERPVRHLGNPGRILSAPDGNLWFTTEFPRRIVRMTPHGQLKAWRRGAAAAGSIALGPEGNIWFAAGDQDTVAVFCPGLTSDCPDS